MDHDEVREQLELAATEPAGIDRLMAGDTPLAAAIAAHLAGCSPCTDELDRLRRATIIIGDAVRTTPPPELRERTLAFVRDVGRIREAPAPVTSVAAAMPIAVSAATAPSGFGRGLAWVGAIAAAVLIAVTATAFVLDRQSGDQLAAAQEASAGLAPVTAATLALSGEPDAVQVRVERGDPAHSRSAEVVRQVLAAEPAGDREYRCWVEIAGQRTPVGKMFFGGDLAFWAGPVETISDLPPGSTFGVSLVDTAGSDVGEPPVLTGDVAE